MKNINDLETNLDPKDWDSLRELGHQMVDDALTYLQQIREKPVWQPITEEIQDFFTQPVPEHPEGEEGA